MQINYRVLKKPSVWAKACENLGLRIVRDGKHPITIRDPEFPEDKEKKSLIAVMPNDLHKLMNQMIFKEILKKSGKTEDEIWKALGFIKNKNH